MEPIHTYIRYSQLRELYNKIKIQFVGKKISIFPSKNILMSDYEIEERREMLERFLQLIAQDHQIINDSNVQNFFFDAHRNFININLPQSTLCCNHSLIEYPDIKIYYSLQKPYTNYISSNLICDNLNTNMVLKIISMLMNIPETYLKYFNLSIVYLQKQINEQIRTIFVKTLTNFESPMFTLTMTEQSCFLKSMISQYNNEGMKGGNVEGPYLLLHTSYWDWKITKYILMNPVTTKIYMHQLFDRGFLDEVQMKLVIFNMVEKTDPEFLSYCKSLVQNLECNVIGSSGDDNIIGNGYHKEDYFTDNSVKNSSIPFYRYLRISQFDHLKNLSVRNHLESFVNSTSSTHPNLWENTANPENGDNCLLTLSMFSTISIRKASSFFTNKSRNHFPVGLPDKVDRNANPQLGKMLIHATDLFIGFDGIIVFGYFKSNSSTPSKNIRNDKFVFFKMSRIKNWRITSFSGGNPNDKHNHRDCYHNFTNQSCNFCQNKISSGLQIKRHYCTNRVSYQFSFQYLTQNDVDFEWVSFEGLQFPLFLSACLQSIVQTLVTDECCNLPEIDNYSRDDTSLLHHCNSSASSSRSSHSPYQDTEHRNGQSNGISNQDSRIVGKNLYMNPKFTKITTPLVKPLKLLY